MAAAALRSNHARVSPGDRVQSDGAPDSAGTSFEALCSRYYKPIYSFVYRMVGNPEDAWDVTQEAFLSAYRAFDRIDGAANINAWLYRIAANKSIDLLRRRGRIQRQTIPLADAQIASRQPGPEDVIVGAEVAVQIEGVLAQMTPRYREALLLKEYMGCSIADIARIIGRSEPAVKSILFRSREQFRSIYALEDVLDRQPSR